MWTDDGRTARWMDDGRWVITIAHSEHFVLSWAKKVKQVTVEQRRMPSTPLPPQKKTPDKKILEWSKFKQTADDILKCI